MTSTINKINFEEFCYAMDYHRGAAKKGVIVFKQGDYFNREYTETERSYETDYKQKWFDWTMNGGSIFGNCLDGSEYIRIDEKFRREYNPWAIDYCYITEWR